jgi:hypothetical protein
MKKIYENFIQCIKERDYESIGWILNYVDPKALHDLICEENPTLNVDRDFRLITSGICGFVILSWSLNSGYVTISVKYSKDPDNSVKSLMKMLYPKYKNITLDIELKDSADLFSITRCCPLDDCISTKFEKER